MSAQFESMTESIDAPVGGWDAFNSMDSMPPENAVILDNLIPSTGTVETRRGVLLFADLGTNQPVETVANYRPRFEANSSLVAASAGGVWKLREGLDGTSITTELEPVGTFSNSRWQTINFTKADEEGILIMCNGEDPVQIFDGTLLSPALFTDEDGAPLNPQPQFIGCLTFKGRVFYWAPEDNAFWYCQPGSYQGYIQEFDLGNFLGEGGSIALLTTWTQQDSGDGKDDFFVAVISSGQTLIYQGDDPETLGFWELVGIYKMAEPLSIRGAAKYGSDTIIMTKDGYVALSTIVQEGRTSDVSQFSRMIYRAIVAATRERSELFGWSCELFQRQGLFIFNVPLNSQTFDQHVMNTVTQRWCRFRDINAHCFVSHRDRLFAGSNLGKVLACLEGTSDQGNPIQFSAMPAFNPLGVTGKQKHLVAAQVLSTHNQPKYINISGYADYRVPSLTAVPPPPGANVASWSIQPAAPPSPVGSFWDADFWALDITGSTTKGWQNVSAFGYAVSILIRFALINDPVTWRSTNIRFYYAGAQ